MECIYCGRDEDSACLSRSDMDPKDGFNRDPLCNSAFYELGGGESAETDREAPVDRKADEEPKDPVAARIAELEADNARLRAANAVLVNGHYDIRKLIARRAEFQRPFDLLVEIGMVEQNALTEAFYPNEKGESVHLVSAAEASAALQLAADALHARALRLAGDLMNTDDPTGIEELKGLGAAIEAYESMRWPIGKAGPREGTACKRALKIEWLTDSSDCETCGTNYAEGAVVTLDGETLLDLQPVAHCHGGAHWSESEVYALVLDRLGYALTEG